MDKQLLERIVVDTSEEREQSVAQVSVFKDFWLKFSESKISVLSLVFIAMILFFAFAGPSMNEYKFDQINTKYANLPPRIPVLENIGIADGTFEGMDKYEKDALQDVYFWFGTDNLGRDLWTRVWSGTQVSFYIAMLAMLADLFIGISYGMISGYCGGAVDFAMQRIIEVIVGIPSLVVVTLLVLVLSPGITSISIALVVTGWIAMSRIVRSQVLKLKSEEFILASRTLGSSGFSIILHDIMPNIVGQVLVVSMFSIPSAIFYESFLAFIGLGLQPPLTSLGILISDGYDVLLVYPYLLFFPVLVLALLMLSFNLLANGLRDAFDPKTRGK